MSELTGIIPAYNEAESLRRLLPGIIDFCENHGYSLIVVNDGSTDDSAVVLDGFAPSSCLSVVSHKVNRGYGGAIKSGIRRARTKFAITIKNTTWKRPPKLRIWNMIVCLKNCKL